MRLKSGNTVARGRHGATVGEESGAVGQVRMCGAGRQGRAGTNVGACPYSRTQFAAWEEGKGGHGVNVGAGPVPARLPERANLCDNAMEKCGTTYAVAGVRAGTGPAPTFAPASPYGGGHFTGIFTSCCRARCSSMTRRVSVPA